MRLQLRLVQLKLVPMESRAHNQRKLHERDVLSHAGPRAVRERVEPDLLPGRETQPPIRAELLDVRTPQLLVMVQREARDGQDRTLREEVLPVLLFLLLLFVASPRAMVRHPLRRRHDPGQANRRRRVQSHSLVDTPSQERQVTHLSVLCDPRGWGRRQRGGRQRRRRRAHGGVQLRLQPRHDGPRPTPLAVQDPVDDGAGGVGDGVAAGDELGERLGDELVVGHRVAGAVLGAAEHFEDVVAAGGGGPRGRIKQRYLGAKKGGACAEAFGHGGLGHAVQVLDGLDALSEEGIGEIPGVGLQIEEEPQRGTHLPPPVQRLGAGHVEGGPGLARQGGLALVGAALDHAKGRAKGQVADDVKGQERAPGHHVHAGVPPAAHGRHRGDLVQLVDPPRQVGGHVWLELVHGGRREGVGDDFALAGVLGAVADVEDAWDARDKGLVEATILQKNRESVVNGVMSIVTIVHRKDNRPLEMERGVGRGGGQIHTLSRSHSHGRKPCVTPRE